MKATSGVLINAGRRYIYKRINDGVSLSPFHPSNEYEFMDVITDDFSGFSKEYSLLLYREKKAEYFKFSELKILFNGTIPIPKNTKTFVQKSRDIPALKAAFLLPSGSTSPNLVGRMILLTSNEVAIGSMQGDSLQVIAVGRYDALFTDVAKTGLFLCTQKKFVYIADMHAIPCQFEKLFELSPFETVKSLHSVRMEGIVIVTTSDRILAFKKPLNEFAHSGNIFKIQEDLVTWQPILDCRGLFAVVDVKSACMPLILKNDINGNVSVVNHFSVGDKANVSTFDEMGLNVLEFEDRLNKKELSQRSRSSEFKRLSSNCPLRPFYFYSKQLSGLTAVMEGGVIFIFCKTVYNEIDVFTINP